MVICGEARVIGEYRKALARQEKLAERWATKEQVAHAIGERLGTVNNWILAKRTRWLKWPFVTQRVLRGPRGREIASLPRAWIQEINDAKARASDGHSSDVVSVPEFAAIAGISEYLTRYWLSHRCPLLGRCIEQPGGHRTPDTPWRKKLLSKNDARTISAELQKERPEWMLIDDAAKKLKRSVVTVKAWTEKGAKVPALGNRSLTKRCFYSLNKRGNRLCSRLYVSKSEVERIDSWQAPRPPDTIEVDGITHYRRERSAKFCDATPAAFQRWYRRGCTFLDDGQKLVPYTRPELTWRGRQILYFALPTLEAIRKARQQATKAGWIGYGPLPELPAESNGHSLVEKSKPKGKRGRREDPERDKDITEAFEAGKTRDQIAAEYGFDSRTSVSKAMKRHRERQNRVNQIPK
jgi:hypothetical protein